MYVCVWKFFFRTTPPPAQRRDHIPLGFLVSHMLTVCL